MQGDNDVCPKAGAGDSTMWTSRYNDELINLIKASHGAQVALTRHIEGEHPSYPKLSKQQLSKRLRKKEPDWPLATMVIGCCTHGDDAALQREKARLAGLYEAATGHAPKGYAGQVTKPAAKPAGDGLAPERDELQDLRRALAEARARAGAAETQLVQREQEVDKLTEHLRVISTLHTAARTSAHQLQKEVDQLRVQLSDTTAQYHDQVARAEAADSRRRLLWERYALLNAFQESGPAPDVPPGLGSGAVHRLGLASRIDPDAPASRRTLAVYLGTYREMAERHVGTIAAASRIDEQRLTEIFLAAIAPTLDEAVSIAAAVGAVVITVRRLHATIVDHIPAPRPVAAGRDTDGCFNSIVASMETPGPATVADPVDCDPATASPGDEKVFTSPFGDPVASAAGEPGDVAGHTTATVAGDRHDDDLDTGDASPATAAATGLWRRGFRHDFVFLAGMLVPAAGLAVVTFLCMRHPAMRVGATVRDLVFWSLLAGVLAVAVVAGICHGCWRAWVALTRLLYRGRHVRRHPSQQRIIRGFADGADLTDTVDPGEAPADAGVPSLSYRFTPMRRGTDRPDRYQGILRNSHPDSNHESWPGRPLTTPEPPSRRPYRIGPLSPAGICYPTRDEDLGSGYGDYSGSGYGDSGTQSATWQIGL